MPDDHSEVVPLLPIPNRTVKRLSANDSADSRVKVGHRQALYTKPQLFELGFFYGISLWGFVSDCGVPISYILMAGRETCWGISLGLGNSEQSVHADSIRQFVSI